MNKVSLVLLVVLTGCSPRLFLKRETPPQIQVDGVRTVAVEGAQRSGDNTLLRILIDQYSGLAATKLEPEAAEKLATKLSQHCAFIVRGACEPGRCAPVDGVISVRLDSFKVSGGRPPEGKTAGTPFGADITATFSINKADGMRVVSRTLSRSRSYAAPTGKETPFEILSKWNQLASAVVDDVVGEFALLFEPGSTTDVMLLDDPEQLKPAVKLALDNNAPEAEKAFRSYLAANPNDPAAWKDLGAVLTVLGQFREAVDAYDHAAQLTGDPDAVNDAKAARERLREVEIMHSIPQRNCQGT